MTRNSRCYAETIYGTLLDGVTKVRNPFQYNPSPRQMAILAGVGGVFGVAWHGFNLITGSGASRFDAGYYVAMSLLFVGAGVTLWRGTARGWWLSWAAMLSAALSGFVAYEPEGWPSDTLTLLFSGGFMLAAAGFFFCSLAHRDVYGPCFRSGPLPHVVFVATPALLIIAGSVALIIAGGFGLAAGLLFLVITLVIARWIFSPLLALLRGRREWHDV